MLRLITCSFVAIVVAGCGHGAGPPRDAAADRSAIVAALQQWPRDFNAKDLAVCALFEDDVVVAYPGGPDNGRPAFCRKMQRLFSDPEKRYSYAEPEIREVLVDGDRVHLTLSEFKVLSLLAERPEAVVSRRELMQHLWASEHVGDEHARCEGARGGWAGMALRVDQ